MKTTLQVLTEARELISVPERWTQNAVARDIKGVAIHSAKSSSGVCWCAMGAVERTSQNTAQFMDALERLDAQTQSNVIYDNDKLDHKAVVDLFDRAIASEREKENANGN